MTYTGLALLATRLRKKKDHRARAARDRKIRRSGLTGALVVADLPAGIPFRTLGGTNAAAGVDPQASETHRVACPIRKNLCRMSTLDLQEQFPPIHPKQH